LPVTICPISCSGSPLPESDSGTNPASTAPLNTDCWSRRSTKLGRDVPPRNCGVPSRISLVPMTTTREMSRIGIGLRRIALMSVKTVVLAPMPSANDRTATNDTTGLRVSCRHADRRLERNIAMPASAVLFEAG
jgi:hypothetical protein